MTMQIATLEALEKAQISAPLTRAFAQMFELELPARTRDLASKQDIHNLELKIESSKNELYKVINNLSLQMHLTMLGQTTVLLGAVYFFVSHF